MRAAGVIRVAAVAPIMVAYDAISLAARDTVRAFAGDPRFDVSHLGCACSFPEIAHRPCGDVGELLLAPDYRRADAAIFHFGVHHGLFDALLTRGPKTRIVYFHNVTPARFVGPAERSTIERSLRQIDVLRHADDIWAASPSSARELLDRGFDPGRLRVVPLVVEDPEPATLAGKAAQGPVRAAFIGRIAPSKGLHDLVAAVGRARLPAGALRVTLAGNTAWSDPAYIGRLHDLIALYGLEEVVEFVGTVDDAERQRLLHAAHILMMPSYHEGFCRPVVEGLRAGCVPLVYDSFNLPHVTAGLGRVVPAGDVVALAAALGELAGAIPAALARPAEPLLPIDRGATSAGAFDGLAASYTAGFRFDRIAFRMRQRLLRLVGD